MNTLPMSRGEDGTGLIDLSVLTGPALGLRDMSCCKGRRLTNSRQQGRTLEKRSALIAGIGSGLKRKARRASERLHDDENDDADHQHRRDLVEDAEIAG